MTAEKIAELQRTAIAEMDRQLKSAKTEQECTVTSAALVASAQILSITLLSEIALQLAITNERLRWDASDEKTITRMNEQREEFLRDYKNDLPEHEMFRLRLDGLVEAAYVAGKARQRERVALAIGLGAS